MVAFLKRLTSYIAVPITWTAMTVFLLCLPGSAFPDTGVFETPNLDKVVHVILFGGIVVFWSVYYLSKNFVNGKGRVAVIVIVLLTILLGIIMEFIQYNYIPNRSFDEDDILANTITALCAGAFFYFRKPI